MKKSSRIPFMKGKDAIIIILALAIAVGAFWFTRRPDPNQDYEGRVAEVYVDNALVGAYPLDGITEHYHLPVPGREQVILGFDTDGSVRFEESDCKDQLCVKYGKMRHVNESFACLPNSVVVRIAYEGDAGSTPIVTEVPDIVVG